MKAKEYSETKYPLHPNFRIIAEEAFNEGYNIGFNENPKGKDINKLKKELKETKAELKHLWDTLNDPKECGELLAGL
jgi:flagellar biosynthesis/type III secretory pathway protein FliH